MHDHSDTWMPPSVLKPPVAKTDVMGEITYCTINNEYDLLQLRIRLYYLHIARGAFSPYL